MGLSNKSGITYDEQITKFFWFYVKIVYCIEGCSIFEIITRFNVLKDGRPQRPPSLSLLNEFQIHKIYIEILDLHQDDPSDGYEVGNIKAGFPMLLIYSVHLFSEATARHLTPSNRHHKGDIFITLTFHRTEANSFNLESFHLPALP